MDNILLHREGALLKASVNGDSAVSIRLAFARPLTHRTQVSIIDTETKQEIAWLESLDDLGEESKSIAEEELFFRYPICKIKRITSAKVDHGQRLIKAETDRGSRYFNLREPSKNITMVSGNHVIIRDSMGNRFEIESLSALDTESQKFFDLIT